MKKLPALLLLGMLFLNLSCAENTVSVIDKLREDDWVCSFFNDVLNTQDRDTYYKYAPYYLENPYADPEISDKVFLWYEKGWGPERIEIKEKSSLLNICWHLYKIDEINGNKIKVHVEEIDEYTNTYNDEHTNLNWKLFNKKKKFTFIFEFDGDYLDLYVNDKKHPFATFCKYDISTYNQLKDLIKTNKCEPWMIEYPKRADGSIDYVSGTEYTEDTE